MSSARGESPSPARFARDLSPQAGRGGARGARADHIGRFELAAPTSLPQRGKGVGGEAAAGVDGGGARLRLLDPGLGRGARGGRERGQLGERAGKIGLRGPHLDAADDRRRIAAGDFLDRADAHQLLGARLQPVEETTFARGRAGGLVERGRQDRKSTRLNSSHVAISYAVFCLKKKNYRKNTNIRPKKINMNYYY